MRALRRCFMPLVLMRWKFSQTALSSRLRLIGNFWSTSSFQKTVHREMFANCVITFAIDLVVGTLFAGRAGDRYSVDITCF